MTAGGLLYDCALQHTAEREEVIAQFASINQYMTLMIAITASGRDHYARFGPCLVPLQIYPVDDLLGFQTGSCMGSSRQQ